MYFAIPYNFAVNTLIVYRKYAAINLFFHRKGKRYPPRTVFPAALGSFLTQRGGGRQCRAESAQNFYTFLLDLCEHSTVRKLQFNPFNELYTVLCGGIQGIGTPKANQLHGFINSC